LLHDLARTGGGFLPKRIDDFHLPLAQHDVKDVFKR
jgi:hypothetical protein